MYLAQLPFYPANRAGLRLRGRRGDAGDHLPALPRAVPLRGVQRLHQGLPHGRRGAGLRLRAQARRHRGGRADLLRLHPVRPVREPLHGRDGRSTTSPSSPAGCTAGKLAPKAEHLDEMVRHDRGRRLRSTAGRSSRRPPRTSSRSSTPSARWSRPWRRRVGSRPRPWAWRERCKMPYTPELKELIKKVEATRPERVERKKRGEEVPFLGLDERKERLEFHPDFKEEGRRELKVGPSQGLRHRPRDRRPARGHEPGRPREGRSFPAGL